MKKYIVLFILVSFLISCSSKKYIPKDLKKLTQNELMQKAENKTLFEIKNAVFKNEEGIIITRDSLKKRPNPMDWTTDRYVNNKGEIKELILRKATAEDKIFQSELMKVYAKRPKINLIQIDCNNLSEILQNVYSSDQKNRQKENKYDLKVDDENLVTVVSIIEKCGMPTLKDINQKEMFAIWLVFQHSDNNPEVRKKYFPLLKKASKNGDLRKKDIAMMEDRILVNDKKPQIYGTQLRYNNKTKKEELYVLEKPESVNKRRKEVGLEPLEEYLKKWNVKFEIKQIE